LDIKKNNLTQSSYKTSRNTGYIVTSEVPYILESNPQPNLIRTSFCRFLKRKKKVRGSNPHLSFNRPLPTRQTDSVMVMTASLMNNKL